MGLKHAYTATGSNDGAKQVSVNRWNEEHIIDSQIDMSIDTTPTAPSANKIGIFAQSIAGRMMLSQIGPSGLDTSFQPNLGGNKIALWMPPGGSTTVPGVFGMNALTVTGTATGRTIATTNLLTRMTRLGFVSVATIAGLAGVREGISKYTTGAGGGLGGFFMRLRFGVSDPATVAGSRMFIGLDALTAAPTNVEVNTKVNCAGVCKLSGSNNLAMYVAGGSTTTAIDLGANFPANTLSADAYELALFSAPSSGNISYKVTRLNTGDVAEGTITTGLPASYLLLGLQTWRTNNATALAVGLDICGIYIETDY